MPPRLETPGGTSCAAARTLKKAIKTYNGDFNMIAIIYIGREGDAGTETITWLAAGTVLKSSSN